MEILKIKKKKKLNFNFNPPIICRKTYFIVKMDEDEYNFFVNCERTDRKGD